MNKCFDDKKSMCVGFISKKDFTGTYKTSMILRASEREQDNLDEDDTKDINFMDMLMGKSKNSYEECSVWTGSREEQEGVKKFLLKSGLSHEAFKDHELFAEVCYSDSGKIFIWKNLDQYSQLEELRGATFGGSKEESMPRNGVSEDDFFGDSDFSKWARETFRLDKEFRYAIEYVGSKVWDVVKYLSGHAKDAGVWGINKIIEGFTHEGEIKCKTCLEVVQEKCGIELNEDDDHSEEYANVVKCCDESKWCGANIYYDEGRCKSIRSGEVFNPDFMMEEL